MRLVHVGFALLTFAAFGQSSGRVSDYAVILEDPPVARTASSRTALFGAAAQPHLQRIHRAQSGVLAELSRRKVAVVGTSQVLLNAIFVSADRSTAAELRNIPGVIGVLHSPPLKPTLNTALEQVRAQDAWNAIGGMSNAGLGVKIAVIDSGIDQNHPGFQDASLSPPSGFPKGDTNFTNSKVIVARSFVEQLLFPDIVLDSRNTRPDDLTPRDRVGHGTAIAMIAAGVRNTGPNGTITGVAPKAFLGNYKVMGSPGVNLAKAAGVIAALTAALEDGMDIATVAYSEGDLWDTGPLDIEPEFCRNNPGFVCDTIAMAVENAVEKGLVVVSSAGNSGNIAPKYPTLNTIHSPGTAPSAITVGAVTNQHELYQSVRATEPNPPAELQNIKAFFGDGPQVRAAFNAPIRDVSQLGTDGRACAPLPGGSLNGAVALVQRGVCAFSDKIKYAQQAGAAAVIVYQSEGEQIPYREWGAQDTGIPAMMIGYNDGIGLRSWATQNQNARVTLDPAFTSYSTSANAVARFSSRGPAIGTLGIKPEIVAPGAGVYTAAQKLDPNGLLYHASGYTAVSGTSMAAGFVAGAAALVLQQRPSLSPGQVKSLLVNTANPEVTGDSGRARVTDAGAGELNAFGAVSGSTTFEPAAISFGAVGSGSLPMNMTLKVSNLSSAPQNVSFTVTQLPGLEDTRASVRVNPTLAVVPANGTSTFTVTLQGSAPAAGSYQGFITTTVNSVDYRIPYLYMVSDGVLDNAFSILNPGIDMVGGTDWFIELKAIDKFGLPLQGVSVQWSAISGGGRITTYDAQTYNNGVSAAIVDFGSQPGDQLFRAMIGSGAAAQEIDFYGYARPLQTAFPGGIVDAASFQLREGTRGYSPGSYISIFGSDLSPALQQFSTGYLPYALSTVSIGFYTDAGRRVAGRLPFVSGGQVNVQIPWELQNETSAKMVIQVGDIPSAPYTISLATYSPAVFQFYDNGQFFAAALDAGNNVIGPANPARRGQLIRIYANGLGPVENQPPTGELTPATPAAPAKANVSVTIGGRTAAVQFAGLDPGSLGVYRVDVIVPSDALTGAQDVAVSVGGVTSQPARLNVQ